MDKLNLMSCFIALVEEGSFTKAASRLGRSKALVSTHVKTLEEQLQVRLLYRSTRHIRLTEDGRVYYEEAKRLLEGIIQLEHNLLADSTGMAGRLRISVPTTYGEQCLVPFLAQMKITYPQLHIDCVFQDRFVDLVSEGFDLCVRVGRLSDSTLIAKQVGEIKLQVSVSPAFLEQYGPINSIDVLSQLPCIGDSNGKLDGKWQLNGVKFNINETLRVNSASAAAQFAALGLGVCFCPDFALKPYVENGQLVTLPFEEMQMPVHVVYPHRSHSHGKVTTFTADLKKYLSEKSNANPYSD
ncbi:LysR family transcriptional regulator (plasmid) [Pseudoalteromonas xiamenensis]|uniref:LysR family transcriptional regulator n=1 Tax=Pseudoalteromonas xiamenensis TaxID=882626 RepID=UPI0027E58796|nr:LysR family transcriptional regulator [Pseudoalteromonas xiamenensis]WMN61688.1 LysR family transcriptional regulator [Pseudoalteromonas xiamenensis]